MKLPCQLKILFHNQEYQILVRGVADETLATKKSNLGKLPPFDLWDETTLSTADI